MIRFIKYLFSKEAWDLNEIKNQVIHIVVGFGISFSVARMSGFPMFGVICGVMTGAGVEFLQYWFKMENEPAQIIDHWRDWLFYIIGSLMFYVSV